MLLKLAWRNIWRNRRRTLITMGSIVFAVMLAILMNSVKEGVLIKMQENVVSFYSGAIQVHQKGYWDEQSLNNSFEQSDELTHQLLDHPGVNEVIGRIESFALSASETHTRGCLVVGIETEKESTVTDLDDKVVAGAYLAVQDEGVLIADGLADYLQLGVADTLVIIGQGYHGVSAAGKFPIRGLVHFASPELNKRMVYLPEEKAQELFGAPGRLTALVLRIDNIGEAGKITNELAAALPLEYEVMDWKAMMPELDQMMEGERAENVIFLFVLYMLIAFGIFGTILMMTLERQYEFGVLVAIGMRKLKLSSVVVIENIIISFLGAVAGTLLSVPVVAYFHAFPIRFSGELEKAYESFGFEPVFYFSIQSAIFYSQTLVVLVIAFVLSVYPFFKVSRLEPVSAMRD